MLPEGFETAQPQQASGHGPTPYTVRPLGSVHVYIYIRTTRIVYVLCTHEKKIVLSQLRCNYTMRSVAQ